MGFIKIENGRVSKSGWSVSIEYRLFDSTIVFFFRFFTLLSIYFALSLLKKKGEGCEMVKKERKWTKPKFEK